LVSECLWGSIFEPKRSDSQRNLFIAMLYSHLSAAVKVNCSLMERFQSLGCAEIHFSHELPIGANIGGIPMNHESGQQYSLFGDVRIMRSKETIDATRR